MTYNDIWDGAVSSKSIKMPKKLKGDRPTNSFSNGPTDHNHTPTNTARWSRFTCVLTSNKREWVIWSYNIIMAVAVMHLNFF